jgi:hypothetical protein
MRRSRSAAVSAASVLFLAVLAMAPDAGAAPSGAGVEHRNVPVCAAAPAGAASCGAIRHDRLDPHGKPVAVITPKGYGPKDIRAAYGLTTTSARTVAIIDAYDAPSAEKDLGVYRSQFGLSGCTTANGCFRKVNQTGGATPPRGNAGWAQEISLDLDMVSATCPDCHILLVEANSASFTDLAAAVRYAASRTDVVAISNSYGGADMSSTSSVAAAYDVPGKAVTASTGDNGYGVSAPASFPTVIAVGGTSLNRAGTGFTESAWSGAGSGCSALNANPGYQSGTICTGKATADVSAVADPNTGVAVYDSLTYQGASGWMQFGGTSASAPIIASVYAMGTAVQPGLHPGDTTWKNAGALHDVTSGSNGTCGTAECNAGTGWDGPTGLGTPNGTAAF